MSTDEASESGIDRASPVPLYHQLQELLRVEIDEGRYAPGTSLPSESEICATYGVSRSVVRQSLSTLAQAGLIRTERGRGSFVAEPKLQERFVDRNAGLHDDLVRLGYSTRTRVVLQEVRPFGPAARDALGTDQGIQLDRLRSVDDRPLAYIRSCLREDRCPGLERADLEDRSLYDHVRATYGLRAVRGTRIVEAALAEGEVARHLELDPGQPVLLVRSVTTDQDGEPLEWFEAWHRADRTAFTFEFGNDGETGPPGVVLEDREGVTGGHTDDDPGAAGRTADLVAALARHGVVTTLRAGRLAAAGATVATLVAHDLPVVAVALSTADAGAAIVEAAAVDGAIVGATGVHDVAGARAAIDAGAAFLLVADATDAILRAARGTPVLAAGWSPPEVWRAWQRTGAPVQVSPADVGGPPYVANLRAAMPEVPLVAAASGPLELVAGFLAAGATAVEVGAALCPPGELEAGETDALTGRAAALREDLRR